MECINRVNACIVTDDALQNKNEGKLTVYQKLLKVIKDKKAGFLVLLDPDRLSPKKIADLAYRAEKVEQMGY